MSGNPNLLAELLPGPGDLPGDGQIPPPIGATGEQIPLPTVQTNAAVENSGDAVTIRWRGDGGGLTGVQRATATAAGTPVGGQGNNQMVVPPSTGIAQVTGATPTQQIYLPMATIAIGHVTTLIWGKKFIFHPYSGLWQQVFFNYK